MSQSKTPQSDNLMEKIPTSQTKPNTFVVRCNTYPIALDGRSYYHYKFRIRAKPAIAIAYGKDYLYKIFREFSIKKVIPLVNDPVYVMDGQGNIYSPEPLLARGKWFKASHSFSLGTSEARGHRYRMANCDVHLQLVEKIDPEALLWGSIEEPDWLARVTKVTELLNTVVTYGTLKPKHRVIRNTVFSEQPGQCITGGLQAVKGIRREVLPTKNGPVLNVSVNMDVFYKHGTALDVVTEFLELDPSEFTVGTLTKDIKAKLSKFLKGLIIVRKFRPDFSKTMSVVEVKEESARESTFADVYDRKRECSIAEYHQRHYGITLTYPDAPCLHLGGWNILPMELCNVLPGCRYPGQLSDDQYKRLTELCCSSLDDELEKVQANMVEENLWDHSLFDKFGLSINSNLTETEARVLPPPEVVQAVNPEEGTGQVLVTPVSGRWDMKDKTLLKCAMIRLRGLILISDPANVQSDKDDIEEFVRVLFNRMNDWQMIRPMNTPKFIHCISNPADVEGAIYSIDQQAALTMGDKRGVTLVISATKYIKSLYRDIKRTFDTVVGQPSLCLTMSDVQEMKPSFIDESLLKINTKLNGVNFCLAEDFHPDMNLQPHMLTVGIALNGPVDCQGNSIKTAAVVGSTNRRLQQFTSEYSYQNPEIDYVEDLESMFVKVLESHQKQVGKVPEFIVCYRLEVPDAQLDKISNVETTAINRACKKVLGLNAPLPRLTYIVCQRAHHINFTPVELQDVQSNPTGTLVEKGVGLPECPEFYLLSKRPRKWAAKPVRYIVLHNELRTDLENIQLFTYALCHMFPCDTRSVYLCAPLVMAEKLAERAELYVWDRSHEPSEKVPDHEKKLLSRKWNRELDILYGQVPEQLKQTSYFL
ncbi:hypothetical protein IWQ62_001272 [Dispira parvispora]|uniref:Piwi domain-containing protein n=1 Tax=Dispira parvispora TaxID=1520584 RepID=A0A9W8ASY4_9FUNG|nr:hypothetical protein IWQ62_001272 [Dispira parvispora]